MNVTIIAGYGDATGYIKKLTAAWPRKYGLRPDVKAFGTLDHADQYDANWQKLLKDLKPGPVIGISFGASIAARLLLEHPNKFPKAVFISGPHDLNDLRPEVVRDKYPMIGRSLAAIDPSKLPANKIMTISPLTDGVINPKLVRIEGSQNARVPVVSHAVGIAAALKLKGRAIAKFLEAA